MYTTVPAVLKLLPEYEALQLADDNDAGDIADVAVVAVLEEAIEQADREIDAYAGTVRAVPLDPVPALIGNISAKLAIHNLYLRRPGVDEPEPWQRETTRCLRLLEQIATGKIALGAETGTTAEAKTSSPNWSAPGRVMDGMGL